MFELADRLVGIYKTHDATKSVTINPKLFAGMASVPVNSLTLSQPAASSGSQATGEAADSRAGPTKAAAGLGNGGVMTASGGSHHPGGAPSGGAHSTAVPPFKIGRRAVLADATNFA